MTVTITLCMSFPAVDGLRMMKMMALSSGTSCQEWGLPAPMEVSIQMSDAKNQ